jgi:hypothetical protein
LPGPKPLWVAKTPPLVTLSSSVTLGCLMQEEQAPETAL